MPDPGPNLYLKHLRIRNLCGFEKLDLSFLEEDGTPRSLTVALAHNGGGKTTLLRALALGSSPKKVTESLLERFDGLWNRVDRSNTSSSEEPSAEPGSPEIDITFIDPADPRTRYRTRTVVLMDADGSLSVERTLEPQPFPWQSVWAGGYGVPRGIDPGIEPFSSSQRSQALAGLFVDYPTSIDPGEALKVLHDQASPSQFEGVVEHLFELWQIPIPTPIDGSATGPIASSWVEITGTTDVHVTGPWGSLPFAALGDGYRATAHWFLDLCHRCWIADHLSRDGSPRGIALVDLLDLHLHPAKQKRLIPALRRLFPHLQIVATTQSPLVIVNSGDSELYGLDLRRSQAIWPLRSPKRRMVDTVLRGEWFGLVSTLDQESEGLLQRFQEAVRNREPKEVIRQHRAAVEEHIGRLFESPLEPMAIEIVEETRRLASQSLSASQSRSAGRARRPGRRFRGLDALERAELGAGSGSPEAAAHEILEDGDSTAEASETAPPADEVREAALLLRRRIRSRSFSSLEREEPEP